MLALAAVVPSKETALRQNRSHGGEIVPVANFPDDLGVLG